MLIRPGSRSRKPPMSGRRKTALAGLLAAAPLALVGLWTVLGLRLNLSVSLPVGLYVVARRGPLVEFCPPENISMPRGYRAAGPCPDGGQPLLKPVIAGSGDKVLVTPVGIVVNGRMLAHTAPLARDSQGRELARYSGNGGGLWVASGHDPRSFDSRYYGPIPPSSVRAYLRPLLIWE